MYTPIGLVIASTIKEKKRIWSQPLAVIQPQNFSGRSNVYMRYARIATDTSRANTVSALMAAPPRRLHHAPAARSHGRKRASGRRRQRSAGCRRRRAFQLLRVGDETPRIVARRGISMP